MDDPVMQHSSSPDASQGTQRSLVIYTLAALGLALFIRFIVASPYIVVGSSMEPNFDNYDYLIVDRLSYRFGEPERGDVVVLDLPQNTGRALIKRIVGLPGETIAIADDRVTISNAEHPDGFTLAEPYVSAENQGGAGGMRVALGPGQYFVLGDNRRVSSDSRSWGTLPREDIVGRVFLRLYPFNNIGVLPSEARYGND